MALPCWRWQQINNFHRATSPPTAGAVNETSRIFAASPEVGQLAADDVEDWQHGLGEGGGVLRARGVAQLQLGEVTQPGHRRQHHQVQVAVVEAEHFIVTMNIVLYQYLSGHLRASKSGKQCTASSRILSVSCLH